MEIKDYLRIMVKYDASDLYLTTGAPPSAKIQGEIKALSKDSLAPGAVKDAAYKIMNEEQIAEFETTPEMKIGRAHV